MKRPLSVTALELPARWHQPVVALAQVDALLSSGPATDLVLLPETSITGYVSPRGDFNLAPFAEPLDGPTASALAALAIKHRTHLIGPLVEEGCFNTMLGFDPSGQRVLHYRKRHPWFPEAWATAGSAPLPTLTINGHVVTLAVCFDLHFLPAESAAELTAADTLLFASAWVDDEVPVRVTMLAELARAFEVSVVNANWGPGAPTVAGQGDSVILDATGTPLARGKPRLDATL